MQRHRNINKLKYLPVQTKINFAEILSRPDLCELLKPVELLLHTLPWLVEMMQVASTQTPKKIRF